MASCCLEVYERNLGPWPVVAQLVEPCGSPSWACWSRLPRPGVGADGLRGWWLLLPAAPQWGVPVVYLVNKNLLWKIPCRFCNCCIRHNCKHDNQTHKHATAVQLRTSIWSSQALFRAPSSKCISGHPFGAPRHHSKLPALVKTRHLFL